MLDYKEMNIIMKDDRTKHNSVRKVFDECNKG